MARDLERCEYPHHLSSQIRLRLVGGFSYAYDVVHPAQGSDPTTNPPALINKRLFAFTDNVTPDGLKVDTEGNVYGGCFDGVHVSDRYLILSTFLQNRKLTFQTRFGTRTERFWARFY
jgi:hypothetical protein